MANLKAAIDVVIKQEDDPKNPGAVTDIPGDAGGRTRYGISERWHPELTSTGFFTTDNAAEALEVAEDVYTQQYGDPLQLSKINDQGVATALLSYGVVEGCPKAIKLLQQAAIAAGSSIQDDGQIGPATIAAVNTLDPQHLLQLWGELEKGFFKQLATETPQDEKFVSGWDNRSQENEQLA